MKRNDMRPVFIRPLIILEDELSAEQRTYGEAFEVMASVQKVSGRLSGEVYGNRLNYMFNCFMDLNFDIKENDGICLDVSPIEKPDYKAVSITYFKRHMNVLIERMAA